MTATDSSRVRRVGIAIAMALTIRPDIGLIFAEVLALKLRVSMVGADTSAGSLTIELSRWSTDRERAPLLTALSVPPPSPAPASAQSTTGRAGRGGRGGRGAAPPPSPEASLTTAVRAAPTIGYIWSTGVTGYSIKYAWRASLADGAERIVLITDRRLGGHAPGQYPQSATPTDADFTLIEMQLDPTGAGKAKTSLTSAVFVDTAAQTLALQGYAAASPLFEVTR